MHKITPGSVVLYTHHPPEKGKTLILPIALHVLKNMNLSCVTSAKMSNLIIGTFISAEIIE